MITIALPPLRERTEDIPLLVQYFLAKMHRELGKGVEVVPQEVMRLITSYAWPGNVRELENALRRAVLLSPSDVLLPSTLQLDAPQESHRMPLMVRSLQEIEREHIINILEYTEYEKKRTAEILGISRPTLDKRIREYGIEMPGKPG